MVKKKLGNSFDQQSKNKESKEQMGSFVQKTAKSVLAFSVLRTVLPPHMEYVQISIGYSNICCTFRKPFSSKLRDNLGCYQLWWSKNISSNNLQWESEETFSFLEGKIFKREGLRSAKKLILALASDHFLYAAGIYFLQQNLLLCSFWWFFFPFFSIDGYSAFLVHA